MLKRMLYFFFNLPLRSPADASYTYSCLAKRQVDVMQRLGDNKENTSFFTKTEDFASSFRSRWRHDRDSEENSDHKSKP